MECGSRPKRLPPNSKSSASIGDVAAEQKSDGRAPVTIENNSSTPVAQVIAYGTTKAADERPADKPATNIVPRTIANPQSSTSATATAGDEIVIDDRLLLVRRRVAKMLGYHPRTLQRWREEGKGPPSTNIGRKVYYELNDVREWIQRKNPVMSTVRCWPMMQSSALFGINAR